MERDSSQRKFSDKTLRDLTHRLNAGIYRNEPGEDGRFIWCNDAIAEISGYSKDELMSMKVSELYSRSSDRREFEQEINTTGSVRGKQLRLVGKSGEPVYVEVTAVARYDDSSGEVKYYEGIVLDVTSKVEMYRNISHQISTPILGIQFSTEKLLGGEEFGKTSHLLLKSILGLTHIAGFLARNLHYMSSLLDKSEDAFRMGLVKTSLLSPTLKVVIDLQEYARHLKGLRINLETKTFEGLPEVLTDKTAFTMTLYCILDNAIKYSFEDSTVYVEASRSKKYTSIHVRNYGLPLTKENIPPSNPNIFTKEYRCEDAIAFMPSGYGLGLYFARRIMQLHGGEIFVEPSKDYWTTFRLAFPTIITTQGLNHDSI